MKYLSICSGIEAASAAWGLLGWSPVAFSEIEPFPSAVLKANHPNTPNLGDMTKFHEWPDYTIDLLAGGTPCQAFSVAGLREGLSDPRGNLTLTFLAIAARYMPEWVVWENVPGVLSDRTNAFGQLLAGLAQLGYGWAYRVLDAQYFGLAQRRRRVFVVGYLGDWRRAAEVLFESDSLRRDNPPSREARKEVTGTLSARTKGGGGLGTDFDIAGGLQASTGGADENDARDGRLILARPVAHCLAAHMTKGGDPTTDNYVAHTLRGTGFDASEDGTGRGTPLIPCAFDTTQITSKTNRCQPKPGDPCHPLAASAHPPAIAIPILEAGARTGKSTNDVRVGSGIGTDGDPMFTLRATKQHAVAFSCKDHGGDAGDISPTLRSMSHSKSHANGGGQVAVAFHPTQDPIFSEDGTTHAMGCGSKGGQATIAALLGRDGGATAELGDDKAFALRASQGGGDKPHVLTKMAVRRLTPLECERLQGFPDHATNITIKGKPAKDGPRYKALGNSMAVPCMAWIGRRIQKVHSKYAIEF